MTRCAILLLAVLAGCAPSQLPTLITSVAAHDYDVAPLFARPYRDKLTRNARVVWGMDAPLAIFGAQVEQESAYRPLVQSKFANGIAQFTPATAEWIGTKYEDLANPQPFNVDWSFRALARYDHFLYRRVEDAYDDCERWAFTLAAYNGGESWVRRDRAKAAVTGRDSRSYFGQVDTVTSGRGESFWRENTGYPLRILKILHPQYVAWGRGACT
ncbi:MAG: lytic transglycosylase domain-containing protein [Lysobacterales bacterium]|nr:MAG: lytic transglycosylase domain-containing protein [Xanthomonadales bacterium]